MLTLVLVSLSLKHRIDRSKLKRKKERKKKSRYNSSTYIQEEKKGVQHLMKEKEREKININVT
jgi:hypothetical protein